MKLEFKNWKIRAGAFLVFFSVLVSFSGAIIIGNDHCSINLSKRFSGFSYEYPLGADHLGRSLFERTVQACGTSLSLSFFITFAVISAGLVLGMLSGITGGIPDRLIMRITDIFLSFPSLLLTLAVVGITGPSISGIIGGLVISGWAVFARLSRNNVLVEKDREYCLSAKVMGAGNLRIAFMHIFPNVVSSIMVLAGYELRSVLLSLTALSFLGLAGSVQYPDLGSMIGEYIVYIYTYPLLPAIPGIMIIIITLGFTLIGEGLNGVTQDRVCN